MFDRSVSYHLPPGRTGGSLMSIPEHLRPYVVVQLTYPSDLRGDSELHPMHLKVAEHPGLQTGELFNYSCLSDLRSLDLRAALLKGDSQLIALAHNVERFPNLWWLDLSYNPITEKGVRKLCEAINRVDDFDPLWLNVNCTSFSATPYLDSDGRMGETDVLRVPQITHRLAQDYGWQRWMTRGYPSEGDGKLYVPVRNFFPDRLSLDRALHDLSVPETI